MNSLFRSNTTYTQSNRFMRVESAFGADYFLLRRLEANERLSSLFSIDLDLLSYDANISPDAIVGSHMATFVGIDDEPRALNGFVKRFINTGLERDGLYGYKAELVPWLWFLDKRTNCRIFQNKTLQQIIETVFTELGFSDFAFNLVDSYQPMDYCVQYQESDFNFVSRLLEQDGLFYYFEHQSDKHIMHICDNANVFKPLSQPALEHSSGSRDKTHIYEWKHKFQYCSGAYAQTDYNFETANRSLLTETPTCISLPNNSALEKFEFPGKYGDSQRGQQLTRIRMQQEEVEFQAVHARSNIHFLSLGKKFKLSSDEATADNKKGFFISEIHHIAHEGSYLREDEKNKPTEYENQFSCLPEETIFRPSLLTSKPRIDGIQTAVVVGPPGEDVYTDQYGRIKLQFHWDRYGQNNEQSSCWVRVATAWAGTKWGTLNIPRIGQEVVVSFVNGDPDQPLVIGSVYNSTHMPPVTLPAAKNFAGMRSRTIKGAPNCFNEFSISDAGETEEVKLHAQKDYNTTVGNNLTSSVTNNATYNVDVDKTTTVGGNVSETIQGNETTHVQSNQDRSVKGNRSLTVEGTLTENITGNVTTNYDADHTQSVTANQSITIGAKQTLNVTSDQNHTISANQQLTVGANQDVAVTGDATFSATNHTLNITSESATSATTINLVGQAEISLSVGGSIVKVAPDSITLSFGASSITIDAKGVALSGPMVSLN